MVISEMEIRLRADIARLQRDMDSARQVVGNATAGMERAATAAKMAIASIGAGLGLQQLAGMVDQYAKFTAQLRLATQSQREYGAAYADVKRISTQSTQGLQETGVLYARIANGTRELGVAQKQVAAITETVNLALLVSGATASESASAQLQLAQAFASGTLRGEEFNAVNEAAPRLMLALADGIGVPVGALKKMAEEGKITSKIMSEVLPNALGKLRDEAREVQTIAGAFTVLRNEMMEFVGIQAQANGVVAATAGGLTLLAQNLGLVAGAVAVIAGARLIDWLSGVVGSTLNAAAANRAFLASNLEVARAEAIASAQASLLTNERLAEVRASTLAASGNVQLALTTNGLIPAQAGAAAAAAMHEVNMTRLTVAQRAASLSTAALAVGAKALSGVLALTGGPIGLLITVLGGAALAWSHYGNKAKEANDKAKSETEKSTQEIIDGLNKQNEKIRERIELSKQAGMKDAAQQGGAEVDRQASLLKQILTLQDSINRGTAGQNGSLRLIELQYEYTELANAMEKVSGSQKELQSGTDAEKRSDWMAKNTQYLDKAGKVAAAITAAKKELGTAFNSDIEASIRANFDKQDVSKAANAYTTLISSIREKITANQQELAADADLADSQKLQIKLDEELKSGKLKLAPAQRASAQATLEELAASEELLNIRAGEKSAMTWMQKSAQARNESAAALAAEYAMYGKGADARDVAMIAVKAEADLEQHLSEERRKGLIISEEYEAQMRAEKEMRVEVEQATLAQTKALSYATQLAKENKQFAAESISDPRAREQAILQIDADVWRERIRIAGEGTEAQKVLQQEFDTWYANRLKGVATNVDLTQATQLLEIMSALDESARSAAQGMADSFGRVGKAIGGLTTALSGLGKTQAAIAAQLAAATKAAGGDQVKVAAATTEAARQTAQAQIQSYGDMAGAAKGFFDENSRGYQAMEAAEKTFRAFEVALALKTMLEKSGIVQAFTSLFVAGKAAETSATVASVAPDVAASAVKGQAAALAGVAGQAQGDPYSAWARMAAMAAVMAGLGFAVGGIGGKKDTTAVDRQRATGTGSVLGDADAKSESIAKAIELSASNSNIELNYTAGMLRSLRAIESSLSGLGGILQQNGVSGAAPGKTYGAAERFMNTTVGQLALGGPLIALTDKLLGGFLGKATGKIAGAIFGGKTEALDVGVMTNKATVASALGGGLNVQSYADMKKDGGWFHSDKSWTDAKSIGAEANQQLSQVIGNMAAAVGEAGKLLGLGGDAFTQRLNGFVVDIGKISTKGLGADEIQKQLEAAFSKVGDDMARWAVGGLTQFQKVGEGALETLVRVATDYANLDSVMASIGKTFGATGLASIAARESLIDLAGGIDELASKTAGFAENFLSEAERLAPVQKYVTEQLASLGLAGLRSRDAFKQYVLGLDLTSEAQRQQYVALMDLQDAFAKVYPEIEAATLSVADAKSALVDAYNAEVDAIGATVDRMASFASSLRSVRDSALLGNLSPLSPQQKYAEAKSQYEAVLSAARGGDEGAQSNYQSAFTSFLEASRTVFASSSQYQTDFAYAQAATEEAARWAELEADVGRAQLDVLKSQVSGIIEINNSVLSVRDALREYHEAMGGNTMPLTAVAPPVNTPIPYSSYGTSNTEALVAEVKALRTEVSGLRADQQQQTGAAITANALASNASATRVSSAVKMAMLQASANERVSPE